MPILTIDRVRFDVLMQVWLPLKTYHSVLSAVRFIQPLVYQTKLLCVPVRIKSKNYQIRSNHHSRRSNHIRSNHCRRFRASTWEIMSEAHVTNIYRDHFETIRLSRSSKLHQTKRDLKNWPALRTVPCCLYPIKNPLPI